MKSRPLAVIVPLSVRCLLPRWAVYPHRKLGWNGQIMGPLRASEIQAFSGHSSYSQSSVVFSPDGQYILTGSRDHTAKLWDLSGPRKSRPLADIVLLSKSTRLPSPPMGSISSQEVGMDTAKLWDLSGHEIQAFMDIVSMSLCSLLPDGQYILTGSR